VFFFQAEDGIRDFHVTGVQTCALPISRILKDVHVRLTVSKDGFTFQAIGFNFKKVWDKIDPALPFDAVYNLEENAWNGNTELQRSEERRVGRECRSGGIS